MGKDIKDIIIRNNKYVEEYVKTEAYKYSRKIVKLRHKLNLTESESAELVGLTFPEYINIEKGNEGVRVSDYKRVYGKLEETYKLGK